MSDTAQLTQIVLAAHINAPLDNIAEALGFIASIKAAVKDAEALLKKQMLERVQQHGPFVIGTVRYYSGKAKKTRCRNASKTIQAILEATGGDESKLIECLSSDWIKHGATKTTLEQFGQGQRYDELFETTETDELREGKPERKLMSADTRFLPQTTGGER